MTVISPEIDAALALRRQRVVDELHARDLRGLLVTRMTNIRYLTGFTGTTALLLMAAEPVMIVDFRYQQQAGEEVQGLEVHMVDSSAKVWPAAIELLAAVGAERYGIEGDELPVARYLEIQSRAAPLELVPTSSLVERLRARKDAGEIAALREAVRITDAAMSDVLEIIRPGMSEHHVAGEIELRQRSLGGERSASEIIVASGVRSSRPHGIASSKLLAAGEPLMFDLGTVVDGYLGDLTRTVHIGPASARFREIYEIVLEAQQIAEAGLRPGMSCREGDKLARDHIVKAGYGDRFGHSLGHSIGLDNHEKPVLSPLDETEIEPGMVLTVEPGIYLPDVGGVRIEDMVVITDDGCEVLTQCDRELREL